MTKTEAAAVRGPATRHPAEPGRGAAPRPPLGKRVRLALKEQPKRLLYPLLGAGSGRRIPASNVDLSRARRVLVLRELYTIGDTLVATPAVRALNLAHPRLEIGVVAGWRNAALWRGNPRLSRLFVLERGGKPRRFVRLVREIRRWRPDVAITIESLEPHATLDVLARLSGAPLRVRYDGAGFGARHTNSAYNCIVPFRRDTRTHQIDVCAGVLRPFGITLADRRLELVPEPGVGRCADQVLARLGVRPGEPFAVVHPGSKQVHNRWPLKHFLVVYRRCRGDLETSRAASDGARAEGSSTPSARAGVGDRDAARGLALRTLLSFGPSEEPARAWFLEHGADPGDLLPPLALEELTAVLSRTRLLICPDTGVLHVGAAVGAPIVGLYGSGDPALWKPPGDVRAVRSSDTRKARDIPLEAVLAEVEAALRASGAPTADDHGSIAAGSPDAADTSEANTRGTRSAGPANVEP